MSTARIIWTCIGLSIVTAMLVSAVWLGYQMQSSTVQCNALEYIIEDRKERMYLTENELNQLLRTEDIYPVGKTLDRNIIHRIEQAIGHHPMVRTAECYVTPSHRMRIRLTQRVPLLLVQSPGSVYFIDTDRKVMQVRASVRDSVLIVTGTIGVQMASKQLADFAKWLQGNKYWQQRIHHVYVQSPKMIYLYMRGNQPRVLLGSMNRYDKKLAKFRVFVENSAEATKDKHYYEYDVRFKGQVIGRY